MFIFGCLVIFSNVLGQVTNAIILLKQTTVEGIISKFVTFKVLFQIQDYYLRTRGNFKVKAAVGDPLECVPDPIKIFGSKKKSKFTKKKSEEVDTMFTSFNNRRR